MQNRGVEGVATEEKTFLTSLRSHFERGSGTSITLSTCSQQQSSPTHAAHFSSACHTHPTAVQRGERVRGRATIDSSALDDDYYFPAQRRCEIKGRGLDRPKKSSTFQRKREIPFHFQLYYLVAVSGWVGAIRLEIAQNSLPLSLSLPPLLFPVVFLLHPIRKRGRGEK